MEPMTPKPKYLSRHQSIISKKNKETTRNTEKKREFCPRITEEKLTLSKDSKTRLYFLQKIAKKQDFSEMITEKM